MGTFILISGANSSGKSRHAEALIRTTTGPRTYIATMEPQTDDNLARIDKHRKQRADMGFTTLELPCHVADAPVTEDGVVLLEDVSNLLGNTLFTSGGTETEVLEEIRTLRRRCRLLVAVTIADLREEEYEGETADYIHRLRLLNEALKEEADCAIRMEQGQAQLEKGTLDGIL